MNKFANRMGRIVVIGLVFLWFGDIAHADPITHQVIVQPVQICSDDGSTCAGVNLFENVTDKIWAQAGIDILFNPVEQLLSSAFLTLDSFVERDNLLFSNFDFTTGDPLVDTTIIRMYFAQDLAYSASLYAEQLGVTNLLATAGLSIILVSSTDVLGFNGGIGRLDTLAHEIGHSLGLIGDGIEVLPEGNLNLMEAGSVRSIPSNIGDIYPDGAMLSQLNATQINYVRTVGNPFAPFVDQINFEPTSFLKPLESTPIPEPTSLLLLATGVGILVSCGHRQRSKR